MVTVPTVHKWMEKNMASGYNGLIDGCHVNERKEANTESIDHKMGTMGQS